jgi:hypothetical protein
LEKTIYVEEDVMRQSCFDPKDLTRMQQKYGYKYTNGQHHLGHRLDLSRRWREKNAKVALTNSHRTDNCFSPDASFLGPKRNQIVEWFGRGSDQTIA